MERPMQVEIWSDVVCPFCYVGKRRFEAALAAFPHRDAVEVTWRSFELDPDAPPSAPGGLVDRLARKYGVPREQAAAMNANAVAMAAAEGIDFRVDDAQPGNTLDAHRLIHHAAANGLQGAAKERLLRAYFSEGRAIGDRETLVELASEVGLDADGVRAMLASEAHVDGVRADEHEAARFGIQGVPFFVVDRAFGVSGAQPVELFTQLLEHAWAESLASRAATGTEPAPEEGAPAPGRDA
jgi:predicted DsbA family dithiol-disulfide isomerase